MASLVVDLCASDSDEETTPGASSGSGIAHIRTPNATPRIFSLDSDDSDGEVEVVANPDAGTGGRGQKRRLQSPSNDDSKKSAKKTSGKKEAVVRTPLPQTPLETVLQIFPDVSLDHAKELLKEHSNVPANVVEALMAGYPKEPKRTSAATVRRNALDAAPSYDFMSKASFVPSKHYCEQCMTQLIHDFPCLTKAGAKLLLAKDEYHFAITHDKIVRAITGKGETKTAHAATGTGAKDDPEAIQYEKLKAVTDKREALTQEQTEKLQTIFGENKLNRKGNFSVQRRRTSINITDPILIEEVAYVHRKLREWTDPIESNMHRRLARDISIKEGSSMMCSCCCEEVGMDEIVQCRNEGHLLCQECLSNYVESQVFSSGSFGTNPVTKQPSVELLCCHGDGCASGFDRCFLEKALKPKVLQRYDELQSQITLEQAGLRESICTCPKCGFSAEVPATQNIFLCLLEGCGFESCRHCREESHIPLRCDEVEKKHEAEGRARVEEAASNAVIRFCPNCKKGIVKEDGCNKMTCACGTKFCYMCRAVVKDYSHFCQTPHCTHKNSTCKGCPLWTKDLDAIHEKAMREAALSEAARVEAESATAREGTKVAAFYKDDQKPAAPAAKVHIDVDSILQAPKRRRA